VIVPTLFPATTDNNYFRAKGIPTYGCIPALVDREELEGVHGTDEKISVKGLLKGVKVIAHFLNRMMPASPGLAR
jgi:acetylornithine deacetylase/succinyl-diaminopimelate desuccinylase-like protein